MMRIRGLLCSTFKSQKCRGFLLWLAVCSGFYLFLDMYFGSSTIRQDTPRSPDVIYLEPHRDLDDPKLKAADLESLVGNHHPRLSNPHRLQDHLQICKHPNLDLSQDTNKAAFYEMGPLHCFGASLFSIHKGELSINQGVLGNRTLSECKYAGIERVDDDFSTLTGQLIRSKGPFEIKVKHDFLHIECSLKKTEVLDRKLLNIKPERTNKSMKTPKSGSRQLNDYRSDSYVGGYVADFVNNTQDDLENRDNFQFNYYDLDVEEPDFEQFLVQVVPSAEVFQRIDQLQKESKPFHPDRMNILIICLDSMSHLSYQRKLPLTYKYMKAELGAVILEGYNIVGDATVANILPLLTGKDQTELPETHVDVADSSYVDIYPLLWYTFEKKGYVTMFAEDDPTIGAFNLRLNGFENQPTDHYMRTFWRHAWSSSLSADNVKYCLGDKPKHMYTLNYTKDFFNVYKNVSRFSFVMLSDLTHWDNNPGQYIDRDMMDFLAGFKRDGHLDNTVVVLMGDHGARYSKVRWTVQGKLEERLPMMSFLIPERFQKKYKKLSQNLQKNVHKLTTPFDIYETFVDVLDLSRSKKNPGFSDRGISLFRPIPLNRTCESAGIDMHWCTCLSMEVLDPSNEHVQNSVAEVLNFINKKTEPYRGICAELSLVSVKAAALVIPNEKVLRFRSSKDQNQMIANFSSSAKLDIAYYQVTIVTNPGEGIFESTVQANFITSTYSVNADVSRTNMYGHQADCVIKKQPHIRKFCYCKNETSTKRS